jgi:RNA polymerase sigma-B factor
MLSTADQERKRHETVAAHYGLARRVALRFSRRGESVDDLTQIALVGLLKAVDGFDPDRGVPFETYATVTMTGELKRHFRDKRWALRVPRSTQDLYLRTRVAVDSMTQRLGRSPTASEVAAAEGVSEEDVLEAMEAGRLMSLASLDASAHAEPGRLLGAHDPAFRELEERGALGSLLSRLSPRDQEVLRLRFVEGRTQSEIAARIGVSQMHVSRLLSRALGQLREWIAAEPD